jgi:large subunit ribosomal protein L30
MDPDTVMSSPYTHSAMAVDTPAVSRKLVITYRKSVIGHQKKTQIGTLRALGLRRLGDVVVHDDTPVIRGMVARVRHLVTVEEQVA